MTEQPTEPGGVATEQVSRVVADLSSGNFNSAINQLSTTLSDPGLFASFQQKGTVDILQVTTAAAWLALEPGSPDEERQNIANARTLVEQAGITDRAALEGKLSALELPDQDCEDIAYLIFPDDEDEDEDEEASEPAAVPEDLESVKDWEIEWAAGE